MESEIIADALSQYISRTILKQPTSKIGLQTKLLSGGVVDSFHLVDLALFIEDEWGIHIDDTEGMSIPLTRWQIWCI